MEAFLVSSGVVALAEIGDKTQLLSLVLATRFRKPWVIVAGILAATLINHLGAGAAGAWLATRLGPTTMGWILGLSFLAMAAWALIPDQLDEGENAQTHHGIFWTTVVAFFLAEMGDKTQVATIALAARYGSLLPVVAGSTLGMMLANVPVVFLGSRATARVPLRAVRWVAALVFAILGVAAFLGFRGQS